MNLILLNANVCNKSAKIEKSENHNGFSQRYILIFLTINQM